MTLASVVLSIMQLLVYVGKHSAQEIVGEYVSHYVTFNTTQLSGNELNTISLDPVQSFEIPFPGATYIAPFFSHFNFQGSDYVVVRSVDRKFSYKYSGLGRSNLGLTQGFFSTYIPGDTAVVDIFASASRGSVSTFTITKFSRGLKGSINEHDQRKICGKDHSHEAKCYASSESIAYESSRAVARLLINGRFRCTGWLVGSEGHIMTNAHCIKTAVQAQSTDYEFMAESPRCETPCDERGGCPGIVEAKTGVLVISNSTLDYSLIKLDLHENITKKYGYLTMRDSPPLIDERIFVAQHPKGYAKRIAMETETGYAKIDSLKPSSDSTGEQAEYAADTQKGSSGSPVIAYNDYLVVALHHRGGNDCNNKGIQTYNIASDLRSKSLLPRDAASTSA